jgi:peptide/nickel transport system substrate-binding protein
MSRRVFFSLAILACIQFTPAIYLSPPSLAQEWAVRVKPQGVLKAVDLWIPSISVVQSYAEGLVTLDSDNKVVPCLAEDWRWIDERTIEFKLRQGVTFHNGEKFNAEAVKVNWEEYKRMKTPRPARFLVPPDETIFDIIDEYTVRFSFPEPDGLSFPKFQWFLQIAPAFFKDHQFDEGNWGYLSQPGPWGTGPFKFVEGGLRYGIPSDRIVLEAFEHYWDRRYPKVERVIFDNTLIGKREEAMRLCREQEGTGDIVTGIRPLDTLKVAESRCAKVVKSKDVSVLRGVFNMRKRDSKFRDIRLRKAINYAVNRKELWKYAAKGNAYDLAGFIPAGGYGHNPNLTLYTYDTTKARALLAEAGYPEGFEVKIITSEAWKLEVQIIKSMLQRIGLKVKFDVLTFPELHRKTYIPLLDKPPEEQELDIGIWSMTDFYGHTGASLLNMLFAEESDWRWIDYDPVYEEMWKEMAKTMDTDRQEDKLRQMVKYVYDRAYVLFIYCPLALYAVNKEVNFVPYKCDYLRLKETSVTDKHWSVGGEKK